MINTSQPSLSIVPFFASKYKLPAGAPYKVDRLVLIGHSVNVLVESANLPILFVLFSAKYRLPDDESNAIPIGPLEFVGTTHSVIVPVNGDSRPILLALCSTKYMLPENGSDSAPIGPLEFVGTTHSVIVLLSGDSRPILLALCSTKYMLPEKSEVIP
jgi:hypothetical protein